jgi:hypothetical protein
MEDLSEALGCDAMRGTSYDVGPFLGNAGPPFTSVEVEKVAPVIEMDGFLRVPLDHDRDRCGAGDRGWSAPGRGDRVARSTPCARSRARIVVAGYSAVGESALSCGADDPGRSTATRIEEHDDHNRHRRADSTAC